MGQISGRRGIIVSRRALPVPLPFKLEGTRKSNLLTAICQWKALSKEGRGHEGRIGNKWASQKNVKIHLPKQRAQDCRGLFKLANVANADVSIFVGRFVLSFS